jgi:hypothetical protein
MFKTSTAIMVAAAAATAFTVLTEPTHVVATTLATPSEAVIKDCTQRPWPYLNCVGTAVGNPRVRLIAIERLAP